MNFATRLHISEDIRTPECINSLFRVANQQQCGFRLMVPDTAKNSVLLGVGILKFIDHCHRESRTDRRCQYLAAFTTQRGIEPT